MKIGLVTSPINEASVIPVSNYLGILSRFSDIYIITGNHGEALLQRIKNPNIHPQYVSYHIESHIFLKFIRYILGQLKYSCHILRLSGAVEYWIFFTGGERMFLPMMVARLLRKPVLMYMPGSATRDANFSKDPFSLPTRILSTMTKRISDNIIVYSPPLISEWGLEECRQKVIIAHRHFLDFDAFTVTTPSSDRSNLIGYIGRLSGEKGIQHFTQALYYLLDDDRRLRILIGGDGALKDSIVSSLRDKGITDRVDMPGWIARDDLPQYLNELLLLVIPSYTEGLPNIMLEAMACGTPVLATPVGAIPDVIVDGKTGFIMENNTPECIAENVIRALRSPELENVAEAGRRFVEENFRFEKVVGDWENILQNIE